jgi:hypothetical protein
VTRTFGHLVFVAVGQGPPRAPLSVAASVVTVLAVAGGAALGFALSEHLREWNVAAHLVGRMRTALLAAADPQVVLDRVVSAAGQRTAARVSHLGRLVDEGPLPAAGDALNLGGMLATSPRVSRQASLIAVSVLITVAGAAGLMLAVSGHLPGLAAPR